MRAQGSAFGNFTFSYQTIQLMGFLIDFFCSESNLQSVRVSIHNLYVHCLKYVQSFGVGIRN